MLTTTWKKMWSLHEEVKDLFRFFVAGNVPKNLEKRHKEQVKDSSGNNDQNDDEEEKRTYSKVQLIGLIIGPLLFILTLLFFKPEGLSSEGVAILATTLWVATWWMTEAAPIPVTSLLPFILFPLTKGLEVKVTASAYIDEVIFLFLGGFIIALAIEKWNLHRRIALFIISLMGTNLNRIILGFMIATGFLSMWISNTATAMMMVPMGLAIIYQIQDSLKNDPTANYTEGKFPFGKALMLGIGYSASIGGIATLIGTPPNTILAGVINRMYGIELSFVKWMMFGVPFAWIFLFFIWFYLVKIAFPSKLKELPGGKGIIVEEKQKLGKTSPEEKIIFVIFLLAAFSWITRTFLLEKFLPGLTDGMIAIIFASILFLIPSIRNKNERLISWDDAVKLPWGVLLLFGGGLAIATGFVETGLSEWIGLQLTNLQNLNLFVVMLIVTALVIFLTEITSNTATATMFFPIMASLAVALGFHPYALMITAGVAASSAFMLPVATPPNAVVFGSGYLRIPDMVKAGFALSIIAIFLVPLTIYFVLPYFWGIDLHVTPMEFMQ